EAMSLPLRRLVVGAPPAADRVAYHNIWFRGHNNPRYLALLPRLRRLDLYLLTCSDRRILRSVEFRALRRTRRVRNPATFAALNPAVVAGVAARRRPGRVVVGWIAAWLRTADDRDGANPLFEIDHLLTLWDQVRERAPQAELWLVGEASRRVQERCGGRDD